MSRVMVLPESMSGKGLLPSSQVAFSLCPYMVKGVRKPFGVSFTKIPGPFMRTSPS